MCQSFTLPLSLPKSVIALWVPTQVGRIHSYSLSYRTPTTVPMTILSPPDYSRDFSEHRYSTFNFGVPLSKWHLNVGSWAGLEDL